jgi:hypothetical protein
LPKSAHKKGSVTDRHSDKKSFSKFKQLNFPIKQPNGFKVTQHGASLHYCRKKEGDQEDHTISFDEPSLSPMLGRKRILLEKEVEGLKFEDIDNTFLKKSSKKV